MRELTHLSLFSGIGGLDLAAEWAGFKTVGQCEWADYPRAVLEKHWPGLPRWRDIRTLTKESFYEQTGLHTVDVISGGFPCQPFSVAGKQRGKEDDRYLWPEFLRVIHELRPTWVIGENVPGIINLALDTVLSDLEAEDYEVQCFLVPACGVDAPHKRYRIAILAHSLDRRITLRRDRELQDIEEDGRERSDNRGGTPESVTRKRREYQSGFCGMDDRIRTAIYEATSDTDSIGLLRRQSQEDEKLRFTNCSSRERERETGPRLRREIKHSCGGDSVWQNWPDEPAVGRVAYGVPNRVDRLKCLGNAVVPQQFYPFFKAIADIEAGE
jgi:DNA (cytosine-5)-methyltransferase 1